MMISIVLTTVTEITVMTVFHKVTMTVTVMLITTVYRGPQLFRACSEKVWIVYRKEGAV